MNFLEKDLEDIVFNTDTDLLQKRGLDIHGKRYRQLRIGNYGIADIVTVKKVSQPVFRNGELLFMDRTLKIEVYELKQNEISINTFMQAIRYCAGINDYISRFRNKIFEIDFSICLIGRSLTGGDFCYTPDFLHNLRMFTYDYDFDGIVFNQEDGYYLDNNGFKISTNG